MTAAEVLLAAALLIVGLGMPALAWVWWVRPLRATVAAPPVLSDAEWQAVLAAVSPPLDWSEQEWEAREREVTS